MMAYGNDGCPTLFILGRCHQKNVKHDRYRITFIWEFKCAHMELIVLKLVQNVSLFLFFVKNLQSRKLSEALTEA